jgi:transposase
MNARGENAWPSQEAIAQRCSLSARSVRTHLDAAERGGWVKRYERRRPGKAWFLHGYLPTIPESLADKVKKKPWVDDEDDQPYQHPENSSGPARAENSSASSVSPKTADSQRPENGAAHPENDDTTGGNLRHDARKGLPTNSSSNSPITNHGNGVADASTGGDVISELNTRTQKQRAVTFHAVGRTIEQIAERLGADPEQVRAWIEKKEPKVQDHERVASPASSTYS